KEGTATAESFKAAIRGSRVVNAAEIGWREAGRGGWMWVLMSPDGTSYYHYDRSRAGEVARELWGGDFKGTLCTDFYAAYTQHTGPSQRCGVHLLRDLQELAETHRENAELVEGVGEVVKMYKAGSKLDKQEAQPSQRERDELYGQVLARAREWGRKWARTRGHPGEALCKRLLRHDRERVQFVKQAEVEATNNAAERKISPIAVVRHSSGGSRSAAGSATRARLHTLYSSWAGHGLDLMPDWLKMLGAQIPLPSS
ncbi:MAG: transposase, partial [Chloroflexota bacterium]|nr:transposase [Chloroflexota bacterium]